MNDKYESYSSKSTLINRAAFIEKMFVSYVIFEIRYYT